MKALSLFFIYGIFFLAFFGNLLVGYHIIPPSLTLLTEVFIFLLVVLSLISKSQNNYHLDLWYVFLGLLLSAFCSSIVNHMINLRPIIGLRLVFRFYLFYLALINLELTDNDFKKINKFLFVIWLLQLPACAIRFYYYGISELTIGTYAARGGGLTPIIPIIAIAYLAGFFSFYKKNFLYLILIVCFILFGIAGEKRVLFVIYPLIFMLIYGIIYLNKKGFDSGFILGFIGIIIFSILSSAITISAIKTLNPEHKTWGKVDFLYAIQYALKYTTHENPEFKSGGGRIATTKLVYEYLSKSEIGQIMFGYGPGCLTGSILDKKRYIDPRIKRIALSYGLTGMCYIVMEYGIFGLFCISLMFFLFIFRSRKWFLFETSSYWKAISFGSYIVAIYLTFIFYFYNTSPINSDTLTPVMYYIMGLNFRKLKNE